MTDAATQMRWGFAYIRAAYGAPSGAWAHEVANNWYKYGGRVSCGRGKHKFRTCRRCMTTYCKRCETCKCVSYRGAK